MILSPTDKLLTVKVKWGGLFKFPSSFCSPFICLIFPALMFLTKVTQNVSGRKKNSQSQRSIQFVQNAGGCEVTVGRCAAPAKEFFSPEDNPKYVAVSNQFGYECVLGQNQNNWFHLGTGATFYWTCCNPPRSRSVTHAPANENKPGSLPGKASG